MCGILTCMAYRQTEFARDEWYHCYTRSITGQPTFETERDYERFIQALYLCNGTKTLRRSALYRPSHERLLALDRGRALVAIAAYCVMPNHFHLLLREIRDDGISSFMQKVGTSFSMYFNIKRTHVGNVFIKPFRSKHIENDRYLQRVIQYIHLNPAELFERDWKSGRVRNMDLLEKKLRAYRYSSLRDYGGTQRPESRLLDSESMEIFEKRPPLRAVLAEAAEYYADLEPLKATP